MIMSVVCKKCNEKFKTRTDLKEHSCSDALWMCRCGQVFELYAIKTHCLICPAFLLFEEDFSDNFVELFTPIIMFKKNELAEKKAKLTKTSPQALRDKLDKYQKDVDIMVAGMNGEHGSKERKILISMLRKSLYDQNRLKLEQASNFIIINGCSESTGLC